MQKPWRRCRGAVEPAPVGRSGHRGAILAGARLQITAKRSGTSRGGAVSRLPFVPRDLTDPIRLRLLTYAAISLALGEREGGRRRIEESELLNAVWCRRARDSS